MGNLFCCICSVSTGLPVQDEQDPEASEADDIHSEESLLSSAASGVSAGGQQQRKKQVETMAEMIDRIKQFVKVWVAFLLVHLAP